ncbi:MAG: hypothetical protein KF789_05660 [Bdellovibrionaceae bacterium]|nr:hypothetical protein [Pseudobdellovibrionaceae bacterium]
MNLGSLLISVKYDLGGHVVDYARLREKLATRFAVEEFQESLSVYNFSHLRTINPTLIIGGEREFTIGSEKWTYRTYLDEAGIISLMIRSPERQGDNAHLVKELLTLYHAFVDEKNLDYIPYLKSLGSWSKGLLSKVPGTRETTITFGEDIREIRDLASEAGLIKPRRRLYCFHDFRTCFVVPKELMEDKALARPLLDLEISSNADRSSQIGSEPNGLHTVEKIISSSWSFVSYDAGSFLNNNLFHFAHNCWFVSQIRLYNLRDEVEKISENSVERSKKELKSLLQDIQEEKNLIVRDLLSIENADLVLKSSKYNRRLKFFFESLNIKRNMMMLEKLLDFTVDYMREQSNRLDELHNETAEKNAHILEILFALNTIAGIGTFVPSLFSSDVSDNFNADFPRMIALVLIGISVLAYVFVYLRNKRLN